jgi:ubiquitin C-terminal hydrolase
MKRSSNVVMSKLKSQNSVEPLFERKIEFIRATSAATAFNTTKAPTMTKSGNSSINSTSHMNNRANTDKNVLPQIMTIEADQFPRVAVSDWLYGADDVRKLCTRLRWSTARRRGSGLTNVGNTCFLNAVLQCLTYTASLAEVALDDLEDGRNEYAYQNKRKRSTWHSNGQNNCNFSKNLQSIILSHIKTQILGRNDKESGHRSQRRSTKPKSVVRAIKRVWPSFHLGTQEDAHECLRTIVEGMHQVQLMQAGMSKDDIGPLSETTMMHRIFGGHTRSQLKCNECGYQSNTFESCMDLSIEVSSSKKRKTKSIEDALHQYTKVETLDEDNKWFCEKCQRKVKAKKQITIRSPPLNLVLHLKRFTVFGRKKRNHVKFQEKLYLDDYTSEKSEERSNENYKSGKESNKRERNSTSFKHEYELYGVIVHWGCSMAAGHYSCCIKNSNDVWYEMDDDEVRQVGLQEVLKLNAYMLFYRRREANMSLFGLVSPARKMSIDSLTSTLTPAISRNSRQNHLVTPEVSFIGLSSLFASQNDLMQTSSHHQRGIIENKTTGVSTGTVSSPINPSSHLPIHSNIVCSPTRSDPKAFQSSSSDDEPDERTMRSQKLNEQEKEERLKSTAIHSAIPQKENKQDSFSNIETILGNFSSPSKLAPSSLSSPYSLPFSSSPSRPISPPGSPDLFLMSKSKSFGLRVLSTYSKLKSLQTTPMKKSKSSSELLSLSSSSESGSECESSDSDDGFKADYTKEKGGKGGVGLLKSSSTEEKAKDNISKLPINKSLIYKIGGGNEKVEIMVGSGLLSTGERKRKHKAGKEKWKQGDVDRRKEKSNISRNDMKSINKWIFDDESEASSMNSTKLLSHAMKKQQKVVRSQEAASDREYQRGRRHDEWDREYDRGKVKKVKQEKAHYDNERGAGRFVNSSKKKGNRFDKANFEKTKAKKNGNTWKSKAPSSGKERKRKRHEIRGGNYRKLKMKI